MRPPCAFLGLLLVAAPLAAQTPGDSVRIRLTPNAAWIFGRLLNLGRDSIAIRQFDGDSRQQLRPVSRVEVWRRRNAGLTIGLSAVAAGLGWGTALLTGSDSDPFTGSDAGDIAVAAASGAVLGGLFLLISPGSWKRVTR